MTSAAHAALAEKDPDTLYFVNEQGDFGPENLDPSGQIYLGDKLLTPPVPPDLTLVGTRIPRDADLDDYNEPGKYYCTSGDTATIAHSPVSQNGFALIVVRTIPTVRMKQFLLQNAGGFSLYMRNYAGSWSAWSNVSGYTSAFTAATSGAAGSQGLVPAPPAGSQDMVLSGRAQWVPLPPDLSNATVWKVEGHSTSFGTDDTSIARFVTQIPLTPSQQTIGVPSDVDLNLTLYNPGNAQVGVVAALELVHKVTETKWDIDATVASGRVDIPPASHANLAIASTFHYLPPATHLKVTVRSVLPDVCFCILSNADANGDDGNPIGNASTLRIRTFVPTPLAPAQ